ncbi:MAG: hypothetical protein RLZZ589_856 [Cyanobacteriota bacterium]|jgi:hypothetical protein
MAERWLVILGALVALGPLPLGAQVVYGDCQPVAGGGVTCDAIDLGDTQLDGAAARGGLPEQSNSSWAEFDPYDGFSDKLGNN